ncbi:flagellar biosynthesis protein FlhF [Paraherbaspirillum soli]|uniref:Flagellar biosynthesis protein FlhF n=1 Tax=Paraherbaspirillum soli TaxID=631222 RepID=A0ABW0MF22_9BURK
MSTNATTIVAPSSREALRLVREQLGPDAIILSNRVVDGGVEIIAMLDQEDVPQPQATVPPPVESVAPLLPVAAAPAPTPVPAPVAAVQAVAPISTPAAPAAPIAGSNNSVISEIHSMRGMIEEQLAGLVWNDKQRRDPVRGHLLRTLLGAGFSARLAKAMLDHLPTGQNFATGMAWVKAELARNLPLLENEDALMDAGGVYALMGPTGVGKTTTTAKLAARCVLRFGPEKLALLTTDSYRIGAFEQLRIYGQILGVSVHAVKDAADLRLALDDLRDKHMVLIDTVGKSQRDRTVSEQVAMLCGAGRPVKRLLLLNAASHGDTLNEVVHAYKHGAGGNELAGCIFTKVDEATHPGALLDTVIRHRLPVHYVSTGQKVPENLLLADRTQLVDSVFQAASRSSLFVPGEADLAERPAPLNNDAEVAAAAAQAAAQAETTERLRAQCQQLIRALAHDAEELAANAAALANGQIGFDGTRDLWRDLADDNVSSKVLTQKLLSQARTEIASACSDVVLAMGGKVELNAEQSGDAYILHGSLLLSDRGGMPLAAPHQVLSTAATAITTAAMAAVPGQRQRDWLQQQDFGKPLVHLLECMPLPEAMQDWSTDGVQWLARARAATPVLDGGDSTTLAKLAYQLDFTPQQAVIYKGKAALQSLAETTVALRLGSKGDAGALPAPALRCVVVRIADRHSGKQLAQWYLLSNLGPQLAASQLAEWTRWRLAADPYFRLLKQAVQQLGGCGQPGDADMLKRLLIAAQASTTVWRLLHAQDSWAPAARSLLAQLAGRQIRPGASRPASAAVLFEGFGKLIVLLDALDAEGATSPRQLSGIAAVQG